jgi:outer membrane lipoprotein-sorting protein
MEDLGSPLGDANSLTAASRNKTRNLEMTLSKKFFLVAALGLAVLPAQTAFAADDLQTVLHKLDVASANIRTTSADFEFDTVMTLPIYDKDVQTGTVYYKYDPKNPQAAVHIADVNGRTVPKVLVSSGGVIKLYEEKVDQVTILSKLSQYQSWLMLGFGASGKELESKWNITYLGTEKVEGITTDKLEMVAKDPAVRKYIVKLTLWMDSERGVSIKQLFDQGQGQTRTCLYSNIKVNQPLPPDAFTFKTDKHTRFIKK